MTTDLTDDIDAMIRSLPETVRVVPIHTPLNAVSCMNSREMLVAFTLKPHAQLGTATFKDALVKVARSLLLPLTEHLSTPHKVVLVVSEWADDRNFYMAAAVDPSL